jgi:hypothetical protein
LVNSVGESRRFLQQGDGDRGRVAFLNRGQGWVVRKLREILPRVRDDRLHADFAEMLQSHEANIAPANGVVHPAES